LHLGTHLSSKLRFALKWLLSFDSAFPSGGIREIHGWFAYNHAARGFMRFFVAKIFLKIR